MVQSMQASGVTVKCARGFKGVVLGLLVAVVGTAAATACAHEHGGHSMGGEWGGPGMFMGNPEHLGRAVDHLLIGLNATDAQRAQIKQIAQAAATDLKAQHEAGKALRQQSLQLFTAPVVDASAVEALRQQAMAQHDQASKRVTQAVLDISKVLTAEQRAKLGQRMAAHGRHGASASAPGQ